LIASASGPAVQVRPPFVRLVSAGPSVPPRKPAVFVRPAKFAVNLRNDGNVAVPSPATYSVAVSTDGTDAGVVFSTTVPAPIRLKPGQSRPQRLTVTLPPQFAAGSYTLIVKLEAALNETNGQVVSSIPFTIA
jgi:hypothetical protein